MIVSAARCAPYALPLRQPLVTAVATIARREGILLALTDERGRIGYGDAAPLAGFSSETLSQTARALAGVVERGGPLLGATVESVARIETLLAELALPSAAACALEQALLDLLAQREELPLCRLLAGRCRDAVEVNALVGDAEQARAAVAHGFGWLKIKVGARQPGEHQREALDRDDARVAAIRAAAGPDAGLRLDANGAWDLAGARSAIARLAIHGIACIEQPLPADRLDLMAQLRATSSVPIAADEAVRDQESLERLIAVGGADAVVIKPMLCGGLLAGRAMARRCAEANLPCWITTTLESAVGRLGALHLAAAVEGELWPCGLATAALLGADVAPTPAPSGGRLCVPSRPGLGLQGDVRVQ